MWQLSQSRSAVFGSSAAYSAAVRKARRGEGCASHGWVLSPKTLLESLQWHLSISHVLVLALLDSARVAQECCRRHGTGAWCMPHVHLAQPAPKSYPEELQVSLFLDS